MIKTTIIARVSPKSAIEPELFPPLNPKIAEALLI
jgi:hypothetical protein